MRCRTKFQIFYRIFFLILAAIIATVFGYWTADRTPPVVRIDGGILPSAVKPGDVALVKFTLKQKSSRDCPAVITREITDSHNLVYRLAEIPATYSAPNGDRENFTREVTIPRGIAFGPAKYNSCMIAICNPLQRFLDWPVHTCGPVLDFIIFNGTE
jgi:hypothetical protein